MYRRGEVGQVARALRILDALRGYRTGRELTELAAAAEVSVRTVRRDITELQDAGFRIESILINKHAGACLVDSSSSTVAITKRERYTLLAVRRMFDVLQGTPLAEDVTSVLRKLEQRLTAEERAEADTFGERFAYIPDGGTKLYSGKEDILDALLTGVLQHKLVTYAYQGGRGRAQRGTLAPYAVVLYKHGLYVLGVKLRDPSEVDTLADREVEVFAAERFSEAEHLRRAPFTTPSTFKLADVIHGAFGIHVGKASDAQEVVIEFSKERARYARSRQWHPTQKLDELSDGRVRLCFTCTNLSPVVSWVLEWGPHAQAIAPAHLVTEIVRELDAARANYTGSTGVTAG